MEDVQMGENVDCTWDCDSVTAGESQMEDGTTKPCPRSSSPDIIEDMLMETESDAGVDNAASTTSEGKLHSVV